jgi:uncharacterized protein YbjT (DUF2867 family)
VPKLEGAEIALASDYGEFEQMCRALKGAETLFLVPGRESANRIEQHTTAVDAAVAAGVTRIAYLSFVAAAPDSAFVLARHHWATEEHIRASGAQFAFLRMNMYLDFIPSMVSPAGVIAGPAGEGRLAAVTRDDVADAAAAVLADAAAHDGATYQLTGREAFTLAEAAEQMSRLTGKRIVFHHETLDEAYASRAGFGAPDWEVEGWVTSYTAIAAGDFEVVSDDVRRLAGHEPVALEEYLRAHPECLEHVAG